MDQCAFAVVLVNDMNVKKYNFYVVDVVTQEHITSMYFCVI